MKNLILNVSCINSEFSERPDYLIIPVSKEFATELLTHMDAVKKLKIHAIEILSSIAEWCATDEHSEQELLEMFERDELDDLTQCMGNQKIKIYADYCRFSAIPKHCDDSEECLSAQISKEQLLEILAA